MSTVIFAGQAYAQIETQTRHVLKEQGQSRCEVVVPREAGPVALFAGQELQTFLSQSLGADIALTNTPDAGKVSIILGNNKIIEGLGVDFTAIPRDGFVIKSVGNNIIIAGRDDMHANPGKVMATSSEFKRQERYERGTIFGVYEFLERFLGVRFYFPGSFGTIVPRHEALVLQEMDIAIKPDHIARDMGFTGALPDGTDGPAAYPYKSLHKLRLRTQTQYIPHSHGLRRFDLIRRFGESNPEYFALMNDGKRHNDTSRSHPGQLCFSSGVKEVIYHDTVAYLTGQSAESRNIRMAGRDFGWSPSAFCRGYVNLAPTDGLYPCNCEACQKYYKGLRYDTIDHKGTSELIWGFIVDIAERLKANNVPGYVTSIAYSAYLGIPERAFPDNVMVMVAVRGPWGVNNYEDQLKLIRGWEDKTGKKIWLRNYMHKGSGLAMPGVPCMTPRAVGAYYRLVAPHSIGAWISPTTDEYLFQYLNMYVAHKVFWNNDEDVNALLDEHHRLMFGKAAPIMAAVYDRFETNWLNKIIGNEVETDLGPATVPPSTYDLWENIYSRDEMQVFDDLFAKAGELAEGEHRERVRYMRAALLDPLKAARAAYAGNQEEIAQLQVRVPALTDGATISVDGLLDEKIWTEAAALHLRPFPASADKTAPATVVRALRDDRHLYFAFDCHEPKMDRIQSVKRERDARDTFRDSSVEIFLNPSDDRKRYRQIVINASGSLTDLAGEKLGASRQLDWTWSSDAHVAVRREADAWTMEVAIPFKALEPFHAAGFPANFTRNRILSDEPPARFTWTPFLKQNFHEIDKFGALLLNTNAPKNLIKDGDFTAPLDGRFIGRWGCNMRSGNDANSWGIDTDEFMSGGKALRLSGQKPGDCVRVKQTLSGLKPNSVYELSFFIKTDGIVPASNRAAGARVSIWDERYRHYPENAYVGSIPWSKQRFTVKTGPNTNTNKDQTSFIFLSIFNATGTVWYDDVQLIEKSSK